MLSKRSLRHLNYLWKMQEIKFSKLEPYALEGANEAVKVLLINRYKSLVAAYNSGSLKSVKSWVEPNLFSRMSSDFEVLNAKNLKYEFETENLDISFFNQRVLIGVSIDRSENLKKSSYLDILSGASMSNDEPLTEPDKQLMSNTTLYFHPEAPCNVIAGISMRVSNSVKVTQNGEVVSEGKNHLLQFECEMMKIRTQSESFFSGEFQKMLKILGTNQELMIREDWVLTDIDEGLEGNPHTK